MELSIIVPVYRAEHCISTCIDSILTQKYQDFELILVDDGAPDRSGQICDEYAKRDSRIQVIHEKNGGVGATSTVARKWLASTTSVSTSSPK